MAFNDRYSYRDLAQDRRLAVTSERASAYEELGYDVVSYPTVEECLQAVNRGDACYAYESSHVLSYLPNRATYESLRVVDATVHGVEAVLGLVEPADGELLDLLDRAVAGIEPVEVINMVHVHTYLKQDMTLHELATRNPLVLGLVVAVPLAAIAVALGIVALTRSRVANRDPLTQAYNAAAFRRKVGKRLRKVPAGRTACLIICDLDDFKGVNDRFGHFEGDQVLKACAAALKDATGPRGIAARMGGDEFLAFWEDGDAAAMQRRADGFATDLAARIAAQVPAVTVPVTASAGGACWHAGMRYDDLYRTADKALYRAKGSRKGSALVED